MTLPKKTLFAICIAFTGFIGVLYAASSTILLNSIKQAEVQHTRQAVKGVASIVTQTQNDFDFRFADWSAWDNTYTFIQDANKDYIEENLFPKAFAILEVNLVLFIQPSGRVRYGTGFDFIHQRKTAVPAALRSHVSPQDLLLQHLDIKSSLEGILLLPEGPMLISSRPILNNEGKGPIRGTLIFGRFLDAEVIAKLSRISRLPVSVHAVNEKRLPPDFQAVRDSFGVSSLDDSIIVRPLSEQTIAGYTLMPDIYGKPAVILRVDVPREIYRQGQNSLFYLITSLLVVGFVFGGVILLLLKRLVLSQQKWQQSEEYRKLVAQSSESIFLVDADTKQILKTNAAFESLLGLTSEAACQLTIYDVVADERESIDRNLLILTENHHFTGEQQYRRQDGFTVFVEINANLISHAGRDIFCIIVHDITKRKQIEQQLLHEASHDSLTGLANRALFMERLGQALQLSKQQENYAFAVLFLDLDRFKMVNDSLGHIVGDRLLIAIAQRLKECLRSSDTFARLGGDEFAVILAVCSDPTEIVERIQQKLKLPFNLNGRQVFATASIGVIVDTTEYQRPEELLRDADTAMYRAKAQGKARHEVFNLAMHERAVALLQLETELRHAIENQEFQLHYQPIVFLPTDTIIGFEALVRWQHPQQGLIYPDQFIPIAEETGLIIPLGWWVITEACRQMRAWQEQFSLNPLTISVNFSVKQFTQTGVVEQIAQILHQTKLDAPNLRLELTESVLMEYPESATAVMQELKALGISLSLDDFGTGYSSLSYLHRFPIDTLKIDRTFVSRIDQAAESWEIVKAITKLANALEIDAIAEGIETQEQLAELTSLRCDYGQGYFFSQPLDSETAGALIAQKLDSLDIEQKLHKAAV